MAQPDWKIKVDAAHKMVHDLCRPRGTEGAREWFMSIPLRRDYDPDTVIADGLRAAEAEIERLRESNEWLTQCFYAGQRLASFVSREIKDGAADAQLIQTLTLAREFAQEARGALEEDE